MGRHSTAYKRTEVVEWRLRGLGAMSSIFLGCVKNVGHKKAAGPVGLGG